MSDGRVLIACGVALLLLSLGSVTLARPATAGALALAALLLLALTKAWIIGEAFMGLRRAPRGWRLAVLGWPLVMGVAIWALAGLA